MPDPAATPQLTALQEAAARCLDAKARLLESIALDQSPLWSIDPRDLGIGDTPNFLPGPPAATAGLAWLLRQGRGEYIPAFLTESQLSLFRRRIRSLVVNSEIALNVIACHQAYAVGEGFRYEVSARRPEGERLVEQVQAWVDAFTEHNELALREQEALSRVLIDGEAFLRVFPGAHGLLSVRFVEPEYVYSPTGDSGAGSFGVVSDYDDVEDVKGYTIVHGPLADGGTPQPVDAGEVVHFKHWETPSTSKRGFSPFYPVEPNLRAVEDLCQSAVTMVKARAKIAWVETFEGATGDVIAALTANQAALTGTDPTTQQTVNIEQYRYGSILRRPATSKIDMPSVNVGASDETAILQMALRIVAARFSMPEYMLSADASNANYSSTLVAESPFVKSMTKVQDWMSRLLARNRWPGPRQALLWRQVRHLVEMGELPSDVYRLVDIQAEGPSLVVRDQGTEAATNKTYLECGVKSRTTIQVELGLDPDEQKANFEKEKAEQPGQGQGEQKPQEGAALPGQAAKEAPASEGEQKAASASVGGLQAILALQTSVYKGEVPREAAVANAEVVFGFTPAEAARLFPEVQPKKTADEGGQAGGSPGVEPGAVPGVEPQGQGGEEPFDTGPAEGGLTESHAPDVAEWMMALQEGAARKDGETWETNGRKYMRTGGKTVRVGGKKDEPSGQKKGEEEPEKAAEGPPEKPRPSGEKQPAKKYTAEQVKGAIDKLLAAKKATPKARLSDDARKQMTAAIAALPAKEIGALRVAYGLPSGGGMIETERAADLVDRLDPPAKPALAEKPAEQKPPEKPAPKTSAAAFPPDDEPRTFSPRQEAVRDKYGPAHRKIMDDVGATREVRGYTSIGHGAVNYALRTGGALEPEARKQVEAIDRAMAAVPPFDAPVLVYRGMEIDPQDHARFLRSLEKAAEGDGVIDFPSYLSTSLSPGGGESFTGGAKTGVMFEIVATRGLVVTHAAASKGTAEEEEVLLPRGGRYRLVGVKKLDYGGYIGRKTTYQLEQLSGAPEKSPDKPAEKPPEKPPEKPAGPPDQHSAEAMEAAREVMGDRLKGWGDFAAAACCPEGGTVAVTESGDGFVKLKVTAPGYKAFRTFRRDDDGSAFVVNESIRIDERLPGGEVNPLKGTGYKVFAGQVETLRKAGVRRVITFAAGPDEISFESADFNGYYTWARCGYSGRVGDDAWGRLPEDLREKMGGSRDVIDLMALPGGPAAWKQHGGSFDATFDTRPDSPNSKALAAYVRERESR